MPAAMSMLVIRADEIRELLPMSECIEVMDRAMRAFSAGGVRAPSRIIAPLAGDSGYFILMPGELQEPPVYGAKIVGLHPGNPARGRPAVQGFVTLFDHGTGAPVALHIAGEIGEVLLGTAPGRQDAEQITLYKSLGIVAQDLFAAAHILDMARKTGTGMLVEFP